MIGEPGAEDESVDAPAAFPSGHAGSAGRGACSLAIDPEMSAKRDDRRMPLRRGSQGNVDEVPAMRIVARRVRRRSTRVRRPRSGAASRRDRPADAASPCRAWQRRSRPHSSGRSPCPCRTSLLGDGEAGVDLDNLFLRRLGVRRVALSSASATRWLPALGLLFPL